MSYSYDLAERAMAQFRALEPWIAEEILDEMEALVAGVFLKVLPDNHLRLLHLVNIGVHVRRGAD